MRSTGYAKSYVKGLRFYLTSQAFLKSFAAAYNNKAYALFKSETTLRSHLVRPKDPAVPTKQDGVVYRIPCECGKVYIGETGRPMQERIKEHDRDIRLARTQTSTVSEHVYNTGHYPLWDEVKLLIVIHTGTHAGSKRRFTEDCTLTTSTGIAELKFQKHGCPWMPTIKKHLIVRSIKAILTMFSVLVVLRPRLH